MTYFLYFYIIWAEGHKLREKKGKIMKKMLVTIIIVFALFSFGCNSTVGPTPLAKSKNEITSPYAFALNHSSYTSYGSTATEDESARVVGNGLCSKANQVVGQIKKIYSNGGWHEGIDVVVQCLSAEEQARWRELRDRHYMNCWNLIKNGKCEDAFELANSILPEITTLLEKAGNLYCQPLAKNAIDQTNNAKFQIEQIWKKEGGNLKIEDWLKAKDENLMGYWGGGVTDLEVAQNAYDKGAYQGAIIWARYAMDFFIRVIGSLQN
jgi:hypothetical protein